MAVGLPLKTTYADGDVYSASDVNDTNGTINTTAAPYAAGKNKIINGDFFVNQRNFSSTTTSSTYGFDRWFLDAIDGTVTYSAQTFTPGTAPVAGYEGVNFARLVSTGQTLTTAQARIRQRIEDVRTFANQTVTLSFWAKASTGTPNVAVNFAQQFGSGGSATVNVTGQKFGITTSWVRYSKTFSIPSVSGKTIGTGSSLALSIWTSAASDYNSFTDTLGIQSVTIDIWGVQVESGSTATAFQTATGTIGGELALCQRYLPAISGVYSPFYGYSSSTTNTFVSVVYPVTARVVPTGVTISSASHFQLINGGGGAPGTPTAIAFDSFNTGINGAGLTVTSTVGSPTIVSGQGGYIRIVSASGSILFTGCEL
jgi:hypothetical protein